MIADDLFDILLFLFLGLSAFGISFYQKKNVIRPSFIIAARFVMGAMGIWAFISLILYFYK